MWGQAWYLPLCLLALRRVTVYGCTASYGVILYAPVWVWAASGFPWLGGETQSEEDIPLHVASLAGEQHRAGIKSPLLPSSAETAHVGASSQL